MKRIVAFFITIFIVSATIYLNIDSANNENKVLLSRDPAMSNYLSKNFKSGISIQNIGTITVEVNLISSIYDKIHSIPSASVHESIIRIC